MYQHASLALSQTPCGVADKQEVVGKQKLCTCVLYVQQLKFSDPGLVQSNLLQVTSQVASTADAHVQLSRSPLQALLVDIPPCFAAVTYPCEPPRGCSSQEHRCCCIV